jgi:hypothetical protein
VEKGEQEMIIVLAIGAIIGLFISPVVTFCVVGTLAALYYFADEL